MSETAKRVQLSTPMACDHKWVHLRKSEVYETGYRRWSFDDVFFCEKCLEQKVISKEVEDKPRYAGSW